MFAHLFRRRFPWVQAGLILFVMVWRIDGPRTMGYFLALEVCLALDAVWAVGITVVLVGVALAALVVTAGLVAIETFLRVVLSAPMPSATRPVRSESTSRSPKDVVDASWSEVATVTANPRSEPKGKRVFMAMFWAVVALVYVIAIGGALLAENGNL